MNRFVFNYSFMFREVGILSLGFCGVCWFVQLVICGDGDQSVVIRVGCFFYNCMLGLVEVIYS